jgi:hypothetical protein
MYSASRTAFSIFSELLLESANLRKIPELSQTTLSTGAGRVDQRVSTTLGTGPIARSHRGATHP